MSELKAINAYQLTTNTEDSDVYIHNDEFGCGGVLVECYIKPEADKVIAELEEKHFNDLQSAEDSFKSILELNRKELRHQKYKRCLAMAKWCEEVDLFGGYTSNYWMRWRNKWLELAEVFK